MRALTATLALAATGLALAACTNPEHVSGAAAPVTTATAAAAATPSATASTAAPATTDSSEPAATVAPASTTTASPRVTDPCPVTSAVLYKALKADKDMFGRTAKASGLKSPTCYQGYATAKTIVENLDSSGVLFRYDTETRAWRPLNLGSGGYCEGYAPAAIAKHLGNGC
ncbi:hypothetical protein ACQPZJ_33275 [Actinoplanes sp. CA-054009]